MIHVGEVVHKYGSHDLAAGSSAGRDGAGNLIGCLINVSNGFLTFTLNGRDLPNKFQVCLIMSRTEQMLALGIKLKNSHISEITGDLV